MPTINSKIATYGKWITNWKWIHDDLILSYKDDSHDAIPNFNQH